MKLKNDILLRIAGRLLIQIVALLPSLLGLVSKGRKVEMEWICVDR
jgi:hypothetical protein